jgi:hypothetical protein
MENGRPIAKVKGGKYNNKIVYVEPDENKKVKQRFNKFVLDDGEFVPFPDTAASRIVGYIGGKSGSGKTYYTKQLLTELIKERRKKNKNYEVYLFSPFEEDVSLDDIDPNRITIDMTLVEDPIKPQEFKNSCVIFDDIDSIKLKDKKETKEVKESILTLLHQLLNIGRHYDIDVFMTNHLLCDNHNTKHMLNEATTITFFPHSVGKMSAKRLVEQYGGLSDEDLKEIKKIKTRWATMHSGYPICVSTQKCVFCPSACDT